MGMLSFETNKRSINDLSSPTESEIEPVIMFVPSRTGNSIRLILKELINVSDLIFIGVAKFHR